ncbi:hypothetical protein HKBW3S34_01971, partial [Candidatus Hakubella thermalkaliphila]
GKKKDLERFKEIAYMVKLPSALALEARLPTVLREPLGTSVTF